MADNISMSDILTIPNGGGIKEGGVNHSSSCMWISIKDYLRVFRDITITVVL